MLYETPFPIGDLDLKDVAVILKAFHPEYTLCECARMAARFAPDDACTCSICPPGIFPSCCGRRPEVGSPAGHDGASTKV